MVWECEEVTDSETFFRGQGDVRSYCAEITHWHPANTWWNRFKAWLGLGKKPEMRKTSIINLMEPQLIFDMLPKVSIDAPEEH